MWLCRDSARYLPFLFATLQALERKYHCQFEYFVGENGSVDDTRLLVEQFLEGRKGKLETSGSTVELDQLPRIERMARLRNALLESVRPLTSDWVLLIDMDVYFGADVLAQMFSLSPTANGLAMLCAYGTEVTRQSPGGSNWLTRFHYYDTLAFLDQNNTPYWPHCIFASCSKCVDHVPEEARKPKAGLLRVNSAFGGMALISTSALNHPAVRWGAIHQHGRLSCEHIHFCAALRQTSSKDVAIACDSPVYWDCGGAAAEDTEFDGLIRIRDHHELSHDRAGGARPWTTGGPILPRSDGHNFLPNSTASQRLRVDWDHCFETAPGIELREVTDGYFAYDPERDRLHFLNPVAAFVLEACDGIVRNGELPALVAAAFGLERPPMEDIESCLERLVTEGLLRH